VAERLAYSTVRLNPSCGTEGTKDAATSYNRACGDGRVKPGHDGLKLVLKRTDRESAIITTAPSQHPRNLRTFVDRLLKLPRCPAITDRMQRGNVPLQIAVEPTVGAAPVAQYDAVRRYFP
jgi:hypothetical protein